MNTGSRLLLQLKLLPILLFLAVMLVPATVSAASLKASPTSISFGNAPVNSGPWRNETLTNNGTSTVRISQVSISGAFKTYGISTPLTLLPGRSYTFTVKFVPKTTGLFTGTLKVVSNAPTITVALSGTGTSTTGTLTISPTSYSFGNVTVGTTSSQAATLTASGSSMLISSATTTNQEFTLGGLTLPTTLAAGQSLTLTVNFKPTASGSASTQISLAAGSTTITASASGTGVAAAQHQVNLSWTPSASSVSGYNVYRGNISGGPYSRLNSSALVSPSYTDATVSSGQTYYYVTTAVGSSSIESVNSNEAKAVVPTP